MPILKSIWSDLIRNFICFWINLYLRLLDIRQRHRFWKYIRNRGWWVNCIGELKAIYHSFATFRYTFIIFDVSIPMFGIKFKLTYKILPWLFVLNPHRYFHDFLQWYILRKMDPIGMFQEPIYSIELQKEKELSSDREQLSFWSIVTSKRSSLMW